MKLPEKERRKYQRFDLETTIHFYASYELVTKVKFHVLGKSKGKCRIEESLGITRNISAEGMRFSSDKKLKERDNLFIEVFLPQSKKPIQMTAQVKWSKKIFSQLESEFKFDTGVKILSVRGKSVERSIHIDTKYKEPWSIVLDSVLGGFHRSLHKAMVKAKKFSPAAILEAVEPKQKIHLKRLISSVLRRKK